MKYLERVAEWLVVVLMVIGCTVLIVKLFTPPLSFLMSILAGVGISMFQIRVLSKLRTYYG